MKYKKLPVVLGAALILAACSNDATSSDITVVEEPEAVQSYEELDERMTEFILASETKNYGKVYEMTNVEGKEIYDEKSRFYSDWKDDYPTDENLAKYILQSRMVDTAIEIKRLNLFEENGILLYLYLAHHESSDLTFAKLYATELNDDEEWELVFKYSASHTSDFYYPYLNSTEMSGRDLSKLAKQYPAQVEVVYSIEDSIQDYQEVDATLTDSDRTLINEYLSKGQ